MSNKAANQTSISNTTATEVIRRFDLRMVNRPIDDLESYRGNARTHDQKQIEQIAASISRFGFNNPVLVDQKGTIIAGHGRVEAARSLGMENVPTICLDHLNDAERRAYILADNRLAEHAGWDR
ncbi:MAG: ParB/Srx family N-terminal domain-containing protein, partial [Acidiferrobacterales bacterium]